MIISLDTWDVEGNHCENPVTIEVPDDEAEDELITINFNEQSIRILRRDFSRIASMFKYIQGP